MSTLMKIFNICLFALVSVIFLPLVGIVHLAYKPWEEWFESISEL